MTEKRIMIVENERTVADELKRLLTKMGYAVTGIAASGEEAVRNVHASRPDLVLMDIRIDGPLDGIETAEHLYAEFNVPVSYLTAHGDVRTLERAKATMPFGYILKPLEERSLQGVIELAIHRHRMEVLMGEMDGWHARALNRLTDAVIAAGARGGVTFMNKAAEALTGWTLDGFFGMPLATILDTGSEGPLPRKGNSAHETSVLDRPGTLRTKEGDSVSVMYTRADRLGKDGELDRVLIVFKKA